MSGSSDLPQERKVLTTTPQQLRATRTPVAMTAASSSSLSGRKRHRSPTPSSPLAIAFLAGRRGLWTTEEWGGCPVWIVVSRRTRTIVAAPPRKCRGWRTVSARLSNQRAAGHRWAVTIVPVVQSEGGWALTGRDDRSAVQSEGRVVVAHFKTQSKGVLVLSNRVTRASGVSPSSDSNDVD